MFGFLNEVYEGCVYINNKGIIFYNKYICEILLYYCVLMILFYIIVKFVIFYSLEWKKLKDKKEIMVDVLILFVGVWIM